MTGTTTVAATTTAAMAATAVPGDTSYVTPQRRLRDRLLPFAARTRIIGWVLLLVFAALGIVTFVTWRLLISATDARMHSELRFEIQQFTELAAPGVNPRTGAPFTGVDEVIREAIAYNVAKPNEKFVGYVDGQYRAQSRQQAPAPQASLARDAAFTRLVAPLTSPAEGRYHHPDIGEVLYVAVPVTLSGDPARGVITAAYLADAERTGADEAARLMLIVGAATMLGAVGAAWLVAGRILRPLRDITETARTITDTDLSGRIPWRGDGDELGGLVATVNGMLDRVETGVAAQRRFIDDAGHELRTPITIMRGHLEVLDPADPADVASTVALVDDELERMNRMVSDLLLLAQSEQPAFLRPNLSMSGR